MTTTPEVPREDEVAPGAFRMHGGCVEFDGVHVLDHLDLTIASGEFVAILGANGSGKTTLVRALLGLQPLAHGHVEVHGIPLEDVRDKSRLALVPQRLPAANGVPISVRELVATGLVHSGSRFRRKRAQDRRRVDEALRAVDLLDRRDDRLDTLSGGQQRRAMIARALASGADTFVLDEPTAGVDSGSQELIAGQLANLQTSGATILLVAHGLGPLEPLVTRVIMLAEGRIVYDGPPPAPDIDDVHHHSHDHPSVSRPGPLMEQ